MEELICSSCSKKWTRQKTRGRKPIVCPDCSIDTIKVEEDKKLLVSDSAKQYKPPQYKPPTKWACGSCGAKVTLYVAIDEPPVHKCQKRSRREYPLDLK